MEKLEKLGHRMGPFEEQRSVFAPEQERIYLSSCRDCGSRAVYTKSAPANWTLGDAPNQGLKGRGSESVCDRQLDSH